MPVATGYLHHKAAVMPPTYVPVAVPGYSSSVDSAAPEGLSSYKLFLPHVGDKLVFHKPTYDKQRKPLTVFRPFPCRSFSRPDTEFMPYRHDPGGRNHFGWWMKRVHVAWNVGNPATTFIVHNDATMGPYDPRLTPLSAMARAVGFAIKKGQGKAQEWANTLNRPFEPDPKTVLEWTGLRDGAVNKGASLTMPKELYLMQGFVPMLGGEIQFGAGKAMPGWGRSPACVFGLTGGAGKRLLEVLGEENEGFRGDPADFERRYKAGDPVAVDSGRFICVYPKGGDPRQPQYASQPQQLNMYDQLGGVPGRKDDDKEVGFDLHVETSFQGITAKIDSPQQRAMARDKWMHWDPLKDPATGRVVDPGILWYPTYQEQAQLLGRIFPAAALVYAFYGEHSDWLTPDILAKAKEARSASVPANPPPAFRNPSAAPAQPGFGDTDAPSGWDSSLPAPPQPHLTSTAHHGGRSVPDQALPPAAADASAPPLSTPFGSVDDVLDSMAAEADAVFSQGAAAPAPPPPSPPPPPVTAPPAAEGFDPPPPPAGSPEQRTANAAASLALAKLKSRQTG